MNAKNNNLADLNNLISSKVDKKPTIFSSLT